MVERIVVTDPKLKVREEAAIADLQALAPDGIIDALDARDKSLGKRLSKLYPRLGYESRKEMIEAFGFEYGVGATNGRPVSVDPVKFVDRLVELYSDESPFGSVGDLKTRLLEDEPELASKLKTVTNKSQEVFGDSFANVLKSKGILSAKVHRKSGISDDKRAERDAEIEEIFNKLAAKYADVEQKHSKASKVFVENPELSSKKRTMEEFAKRRGYNGLREYMASLEILAPKEKFEVDSDALKLAIYDIKLRQVNMENEDLPKNLEEMAEMYPEHADVIKAAEKTKALTFTQAKEDGLLRVGQDRAKERLLHIGKRSVRNASIPELRAIWNVAELPERIDSQSELSGLLPSHVAALDIARGTVVKNFIHSRCMKLPVDVDAEVENMVKEFESAHSQCELLSRDEYDGWLFLQVMERRTVSEDRDPFVYVLFEAGVFTDEDRDCTDVWRIKYEDALEGVQG